MATLNFRRAVAGAYLSAPDYNWNFDQIEPYMDEVTENILDQVDEKVASAVIETGTVIWFNSNTVPTGYLKCDGSEISQDDYPILYALIGDTLPNLTDGRFIKGSSTVRVTSNSITSSGQNADHWHYYTPGTGTQTITGGQLQNHAHDISLRSLTLLPCIKY